MPKVKTHKGASKRFRSTGTGKLMHRHAKRTHSMIKKTPSGCRRLFNEATMDSSKRIAVSRQLQNGIAR
jgi:large subunit ribosomal protein L35